MKSTEVKACNFNVVVSVENLPTEENGVYKGHMTLSTKTEQAYYKGKVLSYAKGAVNDDQCPELVEIEEGNFVIFSDFAGRHIETEDAFCKIIRGHDIVAITTDIFNMNTTNVKPTAERILVEVIKENNIKDGIWSDSTDPRSQDVQYGKVVSCGSTADQYPVGTIVAFDPFCGNPLVNNEELFLKSINSLDIEFTLDLV